MGQCSVNNEFIHTEEGHPDHFYLILLITHVVFYDTKFILIVQSRHPKMKISLQLEEKFLVVNVEPKLKIIAVNNSKQKNFHGSRFPDSHVQGSHPPTEIDYISHHRKQNRDKKLIENLGIFIGRFALKFGKFSNK